MNNQKAQPSVGLFVFGEAKKIQQQLPLYSSPPLNCIATFEKCPSLFGYAPRIQKVMGTYCIFAALQGA
jgi:hypothetical protein